MIDKMHKVLSYARRHVAHFAIILFLLSQCFLIYSLSKSNLMLKNEIARVNLELSEQEGNINTSLASLNSKIDILDSTVKPDEKRRQLIKLVRDAITKHTTPTPDIRTLNRIAIAVVDHSYTYNLNIAKVLAQMRQESNFNPEAESKSGAKGLMQIVNSTAEEIADDLGRKRYNIWDINTNIEFGCYYMAKMMDRFEHDYTYALRAYNFGPDNVLEVRAGEADYSIVRDVVEDNGNIVQYLVDRRGKFLLDDYQRRIIIVGEVPEELRYPLETQLYIKHVFQFRRLFSEFGLDKVE